MIDVECATRIAAHSRIYNLFVKQVCGRLVFVGPVNNQAMVKVATCNQRYRSIKGLRSPRYCAAEGEMLSVRLKCESYADNWAAPTRFMQIVQRHQRAVIKLIVSIKLA